MSEHQESLRQVVARIEASFVKIQSYGEKVDQFRISAGKQLVELQARIEASEAGKSVKWWTWYAENFKNRTRRDAQRVMALARADNPEEAAEEERAKNRAAVAAHRKRAAEAEPQPGGATYSKSREYRLTEDDYAAQIVRDVEAEIANLEGEVDDPDLLRELILQKLTHAFKDKGGGQTAPAIESSSEPAPAKKRGRPKGSKNKRKDAAAPEPAPTQESPQPPPATTGNTIDLEQSAEKMKAAHEAADAESVAPAPEGDLTIPTFLRRDPPEQPVRP
jgi:hypothetical protein